MFRRNRQTAIADTGHATASDFRRIFMDEMDNLHLLALLLTADHELASQCVVDGLEDSIRDNAVFRQWARSWSKRAIIKNAIQRIRPGQAEEVSAPPAIADGDCRKLGSLWFVMLLAPMERFVFVMSVLEGYSTAECAALLGCTAQTVVAARSQALRQQAAQATAPDQERKCAGALLLQTA